MGFFKRGVAELMVARPDAAKQFIIYKHPDQTIPTMAQLTVDSDEIALFFKDGKIVGTIPSGRHTLETSNIPFLSNLVDSFTGGNVLQAEVFFVTTREISDLKFGGRIGSVEDPKSGIPVETMVHGSYSVRVTDPSKLVLGLVGMRAADNESFIRWFRELLLKTARDRIAELLVKKKWPLLDVTSGAYTEEIEEEILAGCKKHVDDYGLTVVRLGNFVTSIKEEDERNLKKLYTDAAYIRMSGGMQGFQQFAGAKAVMSAGEGMAQGGGAGGNAMLSGAGLGVGFGLASMMQQNVAGAAQGSSAPPPFPGTTPAANPFAAPSMNFHIHLNGQAMGPYGIDVLKQGVASGQFTPQTPVWRDGMAAWKPAGEVPELAELFSSSAKGSTPPPFPG